MKCRVACVLGARARGVTEISDVAELREEGPDRLLALAGLCARFGRVGQRKAGWLGDRGSTGSAASGGQGELGR